MKISVPSYKNKNRKKMHAKMFKLGNFTLPLLVYLNNSETENAVALAFRSIQWNFIKDIRAKFSIPKLFRYWANFRRRYFQFLNLWWILYKKSCHTSQNQCWYWHETWTSNWNWQEEQINVKNFDFIAIFPIYMQSDLWRILDA